MKLLCFFGVIIMCLSCSKEDNAIIINNPHLPEYTFDTGDLINTNLPQFSDLKFPGNYITLTQDGYGINGITLYFSGNNNYSAFEMTDPNHKIETCSSLEVDGTTATCNCEDGNSYEIISGSMRKGTQGQYTLKRYLIEVNGAIIRIYNN